MKNTTPGIILLAVLVGTCSAGLTAFLMIESRGEPARSSAQHDVLLPGADSVSPAEFRQLSEAYERLRERVLDLEARPAAEPSARVPLADVSNAEFEAEVRAFMASVANGTTPIETSVPKVAEALELIRETERQGKEREWEAKRVAIEEATLAKWTSELGLSQWQTDEFRTILGTRHEANVQLKQRWQDGEDPVALGEEKAANQVAHRQELERVLSPQQLETYDAARSGRGGNGK